MTKNTLKTQSKIALSRASKVVAGLIFVCLCAISFYLGFQIAGDYRANIIESSLDSKAQTLAGYDINALREIYSKDSSEWEKPFVDEGVEWQEIGALPLTPPYPAYNPYSEAKMKLGEKLFNEPLLSLSKQIACASCHDKEQGFSNGRSLAFGHNRQLGRRNAPSVVMSAFGKEQFWDGRAKDLESQVSMPIADKKEMAFSIEKAANRLNNIAEYRNEFKKAFGDSQVTSERIALAIATYERSLMPKSSKFDRFMRENEKYRASMNEKMNKIDSKNLGDSKLANATDSKASRSKDSQSTGKDTSKTARNDTPKKSEILSDKEILGLHLFRTKARCMNCHFGIAFSDGKYHNLGLSWYGSKWQDLGRYEITGNPNDSGRFKTPSLRQVAKSAPYMHNGRFDSLKSIIISYNYGMQEISPRNEQEASDPAFPKTDWLLKELNLTEDEIKALEAFLRTL